MVGGDAGKTPRIARQLATGLTIDQCRDLADKVIKYYRENAQPRERMGAFIERINFETFAKDVLGESP